MRQTSSRDYAFGSVRPVVVAQAGYSMPLQVLRADLRPGSAIGGQIEVVHPYDYEGARDWTSAAQPDRTPYEVAFNSWECAIDEGLRSLVTVAVPLAVLFQERRLRRGELGERIADGDGDPSELALDERDLAAPRCATVERDAGAPVRRIFRGRQVH